MCILCLYTHSHERLRGHFAQTLTHAQTRAHKLLEGTLLEVRPMVYYPNLNKEYCIKPDSCLFFTAQNKDSEVYTVSIYRFILN